VPNHPDHPPFEIGLVMAGAVSAGAYTAGVLDFLIQALDEWHAAKQAGDPDCPPHEVRLKVLAGASAGGVLSAMAAVALGERFPPVTDAEDPPPGNKFFEAWVDGVDVARMLEGRDLGRRVGGKPDRVRSVLDSTVLEELGSAAITPGEPFPGGRPYLADPLYVLLTLTNLRGVPYQTPFQGFTTTLHRLMLHADSMLFSVRPPGAPAPPGGVTRLSYPADPDNEGWRALRDAALATSAFPVGFAPRPLRRLAEAYFNRPWHFPGSFVVDGVSQCGHTGTLRPDWPLEPAHDYDFLCVDGGTMDNEPVGLARELLDLPHTGHPDRPSSAVLLIDPFPDADPFNPAYTFHQDYTLMRLLPALLNSLIAQAKFKPGELLRAIDPKVYDQFLIAPTHPGSGGAHGEVGLASGGLGGFAGFLSRAFRVHDFQLGRLNCQRFLKYHFTLPRPSGPPDKASLFAGWTAGAQERFAVPTTKDGPPDRLPVIPVLGAAASVIKPPAWPRVSRGEVGELRRRLTDRLQKVAQRLIDDVEGWWTRRLLSNAWWFKRSDVVGDLMEVIEADLRRRRLYAG
jgi:hypothetical protein